ncbi:MAG TPA: PilZ domain-containing protein [bacterium]|nr:PilZ domain-containing protein [bacterium]
MAEEKRKFLRIRADFGIKYKIKDSHSPPKKAVSVNISEGGIMIKVSEKLDIRTILELKITLPSPHVTISSLGQVIYVLDNYWDEYPPYRYGVEFLELKKKDREVIRKFVNEAIAKLDWKHWL